MLTSCITDLNKIKENQEKDRPRAMTKSAKDHRQSAASVTSNAAVLVSSSESDSGSSFTILDEHINHSMASLSNLRTSCSSKLDALSALRHAADVSSKPTEATSKRIQKLSKEVTEIKESIHEVECHLNRSKLWLNYLGQWRAELYSIQPPECDADGNSSAMAAIIVHLGSLSSDMRCDAWVIARSVNEIINLKRKLIKYKSSLKRIEIYKLKNIRNNLSRSTSTLSGTLNSTMEEEEDTIIRKAKDSMNEFFKEILLDEVTFKSEEVFLFFLSSPSHLRLPITILRNPDQVKSSSTLPFASWLGFGGSDCSRDIISRQVSLSKDADAMESSKISTDEELSKYFDELLEGKESLMKDDIAEPAYNLLNELFELNERGSLGWLRKSMIAFVQISFGSTINRQIHETASWLTTESMICYYLTSFRDSFWPPPNVTPGISTSDDCGSSIKTTDGLNDVRSDDEKRQTYLTARSKVGSNIPDFLINLIGEQTTKKGVLKFFEMIQFKECNKQLLHNLLQVFIFRFVPELEKLRK